MASQPSLSDGCWDKAEITDVIDAGNFTVRLLGSETEFIALMGEIQKNSASSSPPSAPPSVGTLVAAQFSFDNQWYRAEVKKVNGDKSLEVKYVDYGNNEKVATVNTRVDPTANRLPCQGVTCSLNRIDYNRAIERAHHEAFRNMCLNQKFTACFVTRSQQDLNRWCIELFHPTGNVNEWFGKKTGGNTSPLTNSQIPTKLPHPHNAGLVAARSMTPASSAAASPVRPGQSQSPVKKRNVASSFLGSVVYSNNPSEFWLQIDSDLDAVMDIGAKLAEHCNNPSCKPLSSPTVGQLCAALYSEDRTWYRGQIIELLPTGAKIYFIDYGNTEEVDSASIVVMPASLQRDPGYAIEACLNGVTSLGTIWSDEASSTFSDIVMAASCQIDVIGTVKSQTKLVNLTSEGSSVGAQLIQAGLAKAAQPSTTASPVRVPAASSRAAPPQTQLPAAAPPSQGYSMLPVDSGQREMVYVSWLLHPGAFWVQKEGCEDTLASLLDSAKECAGQAACISNPAVGTPCVAKYSEDGNWYRGEIVTCLDTSCTVLFIDYGNSEEISKDDIHPASSSLIAIPCQAFKCTLLGIIPNPGAEWSPESHAKMEELLAEGGMCTFLARRGDSYLVEMTYGGEASLQEALVQSGVAKNARTNSQVSHSSQGSHRSVSSVGNVTKSRASPASHRVDAGGDRPSVPASQGCFLKPATVETLGIGQTIEGCLVHMESAQCMYVQLTKFKETMDTMYDKMGEYCNSGKAKAIAKVTIGECYAVRFTQDNEWYRAKVTGEADGKYQIYFVDYGNDETTAMDRMRALEPEFCTLPSQAVCCSLYNYTSVHSKQDMKEFITNYVFADITGTVKEVTDKQTLVVHMMCDGEPLAGIVSSTCSSAASTPQRPTKVLRYPTHSLTPGDIVGYLSYEVSQSDFYIQKTEDTETLDQIMEKVAEQSASNTKILSPVVGQACIAKFVDDGAWYRAEVKRVDGSIEVHFVDYGNSSAVDQGDILEISDDLCAKPALAVPCRLMTEAPDLSLTEWAADEITVKVLSVKNGRALTILINAAGEQFFKGEEQPIVTPISKTKSTPMKTFPKLKLELGVFKGYLTHEVSQLEFYIQKTSDTELIEQVTEKVQAESTNEMITAPRCGQACLAMFKDDLDEGAWYRAEVRAVSDSSSEVFYIDFGNSSIVTKSEMVDISEELRDIAPLAVPCRVETEAPEKNLTEWAADEVEVAVTSEQNGVAVVCLSTADGKIFSSASQSAPARVEAPSSPPQPTAQSVYKFPPQSNQAGSFNGYLTFEVSQEEFYVQKTEDTDLIASVTDQVQAASSNKSLSSPVVGQACIAKFSEDEAWYRAQITSISDSEVMVLFVDFGNSSSVTRSDILEISEELGRIPPLALPCKLSSTAPDQNLTEWAADEISVSITEVTDRLASVTLSSVADGQPFVPAAAPPTAAPTAPPAAAPPAAAPAVVPAAEASPPRPAPQAVRSFKRSQSIYIEEFAGYMTHEVSQQEFYIQKTSDTELLEQVTNQVAEEAAANDLLTNPSLGQACIATFKDDGAPYRASVTSVAADSLDVLFVDFGNSADVERSEIREISEALSVIPPLAVHCRLINQSPDRSLTDWAAEEITVSVKQEISGVAVVTLTDADGNIFGAAAAPTQNGDISSHSGSGQATPLHGSATPQLSAHGSSTSSPARPVLFNIPAADVVAGEHKAYVSHIEGSDCLYLQLSISSDTLSDVLVKLDENGPLAEPEAYCPVGQACIGIFAEDGNWYRAEVLKSNEGQGTSSVLFVDYGNTENITNSSIKVLPPCLREQPRLAFRCTSKQESVVNMPKEYFAEQVNSKELTVIVEGDCEPYSILIPELEDVGDFSGASQLISNTHVETSSFKYTMCELTVSKDDVVLTVSHPATPSSFYCQFSTDELLRIEALLVQRYTESPSNSALSDEQLSTGCACVVLTKEDKYCRGLILSGPDEQSCYNVLLVDYGNTELSSPSNILPLHVACSELPVQAAHCCLSGVYPLSGSTWDDDAISRFYELVNQKELRGQILATNISKAGGEPQTLVSLTCTEELVAETLVNAGFCSKIPMADKPEGEFCKELCLEIREKFSDVLDKTNNLADKMNAFVTRFSDVLHKQLDDMDEMLMSECTAQDLIYHISQHTLSQMLNTPYTPQITPSVCDKESMRMEMQTLMGELLEEVMRSNSALVDNMFDEAIVGLDNISRFSSSDLPEEEPLATETKVETQQNEQVISEQSDSVTDLSDKEVTLSEPVDVLVDSPVEVVVDSSADQPADTVNQSQVSEDTQVEAEEASETSEPAGSEEGQAEETQPEASADSPQSNPDDKEVSAKSEEAPAKDTDNTQIEDIKASHSDTAATEDQPPEVTEESSINADTDEDTQNKTDDDTPAESQEEKTADDEVTSSLTGDIEVEDVTSSEQETVDEEITSAIDDETANKSGDIEGDVVTSSEQGAVKEEMTQAVDDETDNSGAGDCMKSPDHETEGKAMATAVKEQKENCNGINGDSDSVEASIVEQES